MEEPRLELRMYGLVPYNISPIQQGIQFGHAVVEYAQRFFKDENYQKWAQNDKTFIILNGGTTNLGNVSLGVEKGSLNKHLDTLILNRINYETFHEPDLGNQLTAVVFIVDERIWNKEKYPDFRVIPLLKEDGTVEEADAYSKLKQYENWVKLIGGEQNVWLREFLSQFRLA